MISVLQAKQLYNLDIMRFNSIISAMPVHIKNYAKENAGKNIHMSYYEKTVKSSHLSAIAYNSFMDEAKDASMLFKKSEQWGTELKQELEVDELSQCFKDIYRCTNIAKYRSFQYRLLHRGIITNIHLKHWGLKDSKYM